MATSDPNQNQRALMNAQDLKADGHKRLSRRIWLRDAAIAATGAVVLPSLLTGCTKEHWDHLKGKVTSGGLGSSPDTRYYLKVTYQDRWNETREGYMGSIANVPGSSPNWDSIKIADTRYRSDGACRFKLHPAENGWAYWEIDDGYWLSLRLSGWAYRSYYYNSSIGWKIVGGKLYNNYYFWENYPAGCQWYGSPQENLHLHAYYVGVDLDNKNEFTCELVPAE